MKKLEVERLLHSFHVEPKHRKKEQCHIPDAASILNTAITEQMGYGIVSFFVCFLSWGASA